VGSGDFQIAEIPETCRFPLPLVDIEPARFPRAVFLVDLPAAFEYIREIQTRNHRWAPLTVKREVTAA